MPYARPPSRAACHPRTGAQPVRHVATIGGQPAMDHVPHNEGVTCMSRRRGKHAARRPRRRMLLLSMGLAVGVFFAILFGNEFIRANPTVDPAVAAADLDIQRSSDNEVSRDHTRSAPPSVP